MSTLDIRNNSAVMKRAEQLKRWEESDTNRAAAVPRHEHGRRIKFSSGCVFLAACLSGDKDEVIQLLDQGADINTANVDGLTALHQACIDDNLDMVEFLIEHGADINRQDNEGWTPLHATASCGFVSIARFLVENDADVAAVNSDGDLALDLAIDVQHMAMIDYMEKVVQELNIDVELARKAEEVAMLNDAKKWLRSDASEVDRPHPKTGATALHVAAAKGYTKVLSLLLAGRGNVDRQDNDGWTPLHAAAHWGQKETAEMLVESLADMDIRNYAGQSCIDVADRKMVKFLEELRANKRNKRRPSSQIRISDTIENHVEKTPTKLVRVEVRTDATKDAENIKANANQQIHAAEHPVEEDAPWRRKTPRTPNDSPTKNQVPDKDTSGKLAESNDVILRRTQSFENDQKFYQKYNELRARIKANSCPILPASAISTTTAATATPGAVTGAATATATANSGAATTNNNNNFNSNNNNNNNNNNNKGTALLLGYAANVTQAPTTTTTTARPISTTTTTLNTNTNNTNASASATATNQSQIYTIQRSASLKDNSMYYRKPQAALSPAATVGNATPTTPTTTASTLSSPSTAALNPPIRRSFVPPVRDEESETQRKAHAKRVRETRRSTQGVTLDEIKSAEELVKKKNMGMANNNNNNNSSGNEMQATSSTTSTTTTTTSNTDQEPQQPPPPPTTPPPSLIPTDATDESEVEATSYADTSASFTLAAPARKSHESGDGDVSHRSERSEANRADDEVVSASYTIVTNKQKTDEVAKHLKEEETKSEAFAPHLRPIDLPILPVIPTGEAPKVTTPVAGTPNSTSSLESPVRLRDKRGLVGGPPGNDAEAKAAETPALTSPAHADFNARDSLLSLYARRTESIGAGGSSGGVVTAPVSTTSLTSTTSSTSSFSSAERRPSWRLKFDAGSKFKLEDITSGGTYPPNNSTIIPSAPAVLAAANLANSGTSQRRISSGPNAINSSNQSLNSVGRPVSAPSVGSQNESTSNSIFATPVAPARKYESAAPSSANNSSTVAATTTAASTEDKDNDKENDNRTQTIIQRRRKPKRRSTGVVHIDMDELDPERQNESSNNDNEEKESGSERTSRSRLGSSASTATTSGTSESKSSSEKAENGDGIDYKALWEAAKLENDKLKQMLKQKDEENVQTRATLERFANAQLDVYKTDNHRLKEENAALIRVISKLSK